MTAALLQSAPVRQQTVTIRPAPRREPPFDTEADGPASPPCRPRDGGFAACLPFEAVRAEPHVWRARPAPDGGLPDPAQWARRLLLGMTETAGGRRPLHQLAAFLSPSVHHGITREFERSNQRGVPHWLCRATVRTVHASRPGDGVAELCAVLESGPRVRALAMRLERNHGRWRCVRLQIG